MQSLLTLDDVAANLGCSPVMVQRLIALGVLNASQLTEGSVRSFRISQPQLEAYIAAGSPRFKLPVGSEHLANNEDQWFDDNHIRPLAKLFEQTVDERLDSLLPDPQEKLPAGVTADPRGGTFRQVQIDVPAADIDDLLTMAVPYGNHVGLTASMPGRVTFEGQWREAFLVNRLWNFLQAEVTDAAGISHLGGPRKLYQTPAVFNRFVDQAWERVQAGRISQTRRYHVTFIEQRYQDAKAQLVSQTEAVQTIEVELMLRMERIAAGTRASVVRRAL